RVAFVERDTGVFRVHSTETGKLLWKSSHVEKSRPDGEWKWVWSTVALSPDGNLLAAQTENTAVVEIWDLRSGKHCRTLAIDQIVRRHDAACLAWSQDNRMLAVGGLDNSVRLWEVASSQVRREFRGHVCPARCLAYLPDGNLASGSEDNTLLVWKTLPDI